MLFLCLLDSLHNHCPSYFTFLCTYNNILFLTNLLNLTTMPAQEWQRIPTIVSTFKDVIYFNKWWKGQISPVLMLMEVEEIYLLETLQCSALTPTVWTNPGHGTRKWARLFPNFFSQVTVSPLDVLGIATMADLLLPLVGSYSGFLSYDFLRAWSITSTVNV